MIQQVTRIFPFVILLALCLGRDSSTVSIHDKSTITDSLIIPVQETNGNEFLETENRLPQLLRDVKVLLTDALIADVWKDTLEVIYTLDRIFDLLTEADQLGEMNEADREEFKRFEDSMVKIYGHKFLTLSKVDVPHTAEQFRKDVTEFTEPLEVEMGETQFIVLDDRDGHIPLVKNKKVEQFINFFQTKGRRQFEIWLKRKKKYGPMILSILKEHELPEELLYLAMIESGFNPKAYSHAKAAGMWQFISSTGKKYDLNWSWYVDERRDPEKATIAACRYLKDLYKEFDHWYLALAAYNAGSGRIHRAQRLHRTSDFWQLHSLPRETRNYMPYYLAAAIIGSNPKEFGFDENKIKGEPWRYDTVLLEKSADLSVLAMAAGIKLKTIKDFNPELRQSATPADGAYTIKLPLGTKSRFLNEFNALPEDQRFSPQYIFHRVKKGESLWTISRKYGISIHDIASINKIKNRHRIRQGKILTIPTRGVLTKQNSVVTGLASTHSKHIYTVKKNDTLGHIAEDYKTRARKIRKWNNLKYGHYIFPGQKLTIWTKKG